MPKPRTSPWRRDSTNPASDKPGAVHRAFRDGDPPIGSADAVPRTSIRAFEDIVPKSTDWRDLARPDEGPASQAAE
ncbi:hypothetical protein [Azospirillum palustre]|uniref:hypothetical protein n=1 Tax=Azospirillum palustre TaxID=2044885 RepID=UPI00117752F9|nr:hypothetical protein [Azospirillum palustre]